MATFVDVDDSEITVAIAVTDAVAKGTVVVFPDGKERIVIFRRLSTTVDHYVCAIPTRVPPGLMR